jgi:hypothetical protein
VLAANKGVPDPDAPGFSHRVSGELEAAQVAGERAQGTAETMMCVYGSDG